MRNLALLAGVVAALGPMGAPAAAQGRLSIEEIAVVDGRLRAVLRLEDALDADRRASVERGLPVTVRFTTELWRERRRWWNAQVASRVRSYRVRWDPGERLFQLVPADRRARGQSFETLDALLEELGRQSVDLHPREELRDDHRYYVFAEAAIRPLTLEEFHELDGWISGRLGGSLPPADESGDPGEPPPDGGSVPGALFDFLRNWAGFGDTVLEARSDTFRPAELVVR